MRFRHGLVFLFLVLGLSSNIQSNELPDNSIYHINSSWLNNNNRQLNITSLQGKTQIIAFIYTYCEHSCPAIFANLKSLEQKLSEKQRQSVQFTLISLDPKRDSPAVLDQYLDDKNVDKNRWQALSGDPEDVLELSALIGVRYKPMDMESGDIAHSNMLTILDSSGVIRYQQKGLQNDIEQLIMQIDKSTTNL